MIIYRKIIQNYGVRAVMHSCNVLFCIRWHPCLYFGTLPIIDTPMWGPGLRIFVFPQPGGRCRSCPSAEVCIFFFFEVCILAHSLSSMWGPGLHIFVPPQPGRASGRCRSCPNAEVAPQCTPNCTAAPADCTAMSFVFVC